VPSTVEPLVETADKIRTVMTFAYEGLRLTADRELGDAVEVSLPKSMPKEREGQILAWLRRERLFIVRYVAWLDGYAAIVDDILAVCGFDPFQAEYVRFCAKAMRDRLSPELAEFTNELHGWLSRSGVAGSRHTG